ncbi:hypothetical protein [Methylogaea oryzae]|uniref:hypothetical protein n=1 Tax=Methylogaea oryzae TaxID=1295382 RepID=UPI0012E1539E|nr:hypothetical protein [Methylogaea oryzae]
MIAAAVADQQDGGQVEPQSGGDSVNISDEAIQALEQDRSQANLEAQVDQDPNFAAEMAKSLAYRADTAVVPKPVRPGGGDTYDARTLPVMQMSGETIRLKRIALYEAELQKGTPPAQIYHKLSQFMNRMVDF